MTKLLTKTNSRASDTATAVKSFMRSAFTFDPIAARMLDDTFVSVHLNSRIWMV